MSRHNVFGKQDPEEEKQMTREARLQYDPDLVNESVQRWGSYSEAEKQRIMDEGNRIYHDLATALEKGIPGHDERVQTILERWHDHLRYFYEPNLDVLRGLGQLYNTSPEFMANFEKLHPELPAYLNDAIDHYVDVLETAAIEQMLAEDEERLRRLGGDS